MTVRHATSAGPAGQVQPQSSGPSPRSRRPRRKSPENLAAEAFYGQAVSEALERLLTQDCPPEDARVQHAAREAFRAAEASPEAREAGSPAAGRRHALSLILGHNSSTLLTRDLRRELIETYVKKSCRRQRALSRASQLRQTYMRGSVDLAEKIEGCGQSLTHELGVSPTGEEVLSLLHCDFCSKYRVCDTCAHARSGRIIRGVIPKMRKLIGEGFRPLMVTFTTRNHADLETAFNQQREAVKGVFDRIRKARSKSGRHVSAFAPIVGGVTQMEIKRGKGSGLWHPHTHGVIFDRGDLRFGAAIDEYEHYTGGRGCHFDELHSYKLVQSGTPWHQVVPELHKDLCEVLKYPVKSGSMSCEDLLRVENWFGDTKKRVLHSYGRCRVKLNEDEDFLADQERVTGGFGVWIMARWMDGVYLPEYAHRVGDWSWAEKLAS